jgi:DNA ligase-1
MLAMTFKRLCEHFQELESVSSRNVMVEILARLFAEAEAGEIDQIVYLMQGRVAPLFEPVEFGMAEKMVVRAMAQAYGADVADVTHEFKKTGDIGEVAEELSHKSQVKSQKPNLKVAQVFGKLQEITRVGGEGSVEKKISILSDLFKGSDPVSSRFIARIPVDKLRLGFSDMTVLEGLSWMIDGTKKHKPIIEAAYNIRPDLGEIAHKIKTSGISQIRQIGPKVGTPILVMRAERLSSPAAIIEEIGECAVEPKLDGLRTQLHFKRSQISKVKSQKSRNSDGCEVRLFSRGMENVTEMYPDLIEASGEELGKFDELILDGEAIGFDPKTGKFVNFQETTQRKRKYGIEEISKSIPVRYVVFDALYLNGKSLINEPYSQRRKMVERLSGPIIVPADAKIIDEAPDLEKFFQDCMSKGFEGIMAKKLDGVYQAGARGWNWIKFKGSYTEKLNDTIDAVVMGIDYGQGKRNSFGVGAFLIGVYDQKSDSFKTVSKVGTGLTDEEWKNLKAQSEKLKSEKKPVNYDVNKLNDCDVWVKPKLVGEFRADELTKSPMHTSGWALRFPRLVRWREKKPEDTTSISELKRLQGQAL